jgi:nitronate monooxygenase
LILDELRHPIVQAPLAGGPSTPELCVAVGEAGGLGFLAAGYRKPEEVAEEIRTVRERTGAPFGVNLFVPGPDEVDEEAVRAYVERLGPDAGEPRYDDDGWEGKLRVVRDEHVPLVSFTFGCPSGEQVAALREAGCEVWVTVTDPEEARVAVWAGADALVCQGVEAGGHRASFVDREGAEGLGALALLRAVASETELPLVAAGGVADGASLAAVLAAGASAAQLGTAFLLAPEAGTHPAHRDALRQDTPTALTRAFTGRLARGLLNRFMDEHPGAPVAYPQLNHATAPLRAAARERGDAGGFNLWAGQGYRLAREEPAAATVARIAAEAGEAVSRTAAVLGATRRGP